MKRIAIAAAALATATGWAHPGYGPGYGMGPGMMGGYGPGYGMGPGMMGGYGPGYGLDLTDEQRAKLAQIHEELAGKRWALMEKMHEQGYAGYGAFRGGEFDEQAARKSYEAMAATRNAMFEAWLEARKRMEAVLTDEQRQKLEQRWRRR